VAGPSQVSTSEALACERFLLPRLLRPRRSRRLLLSCQLIYSPVDAKSIEKVLKAILVGIIKEIIVVSVSVLR